MLPLKIKTPYYAVIFTSKLSMNQKGYAEWDARISGLVEKAEGYLGHESYRNDDGTGVTISYWANLESIANWKKELLHLKAQELGRHQWYHQYKIRICKVEKEYEFESENSAEK